MTECRVTFLPANIEIKTPAGTNVLETAFQAGLNLKSTCGGSGTCGQCTIILRKSGTQIIEDYALACQTLIDDDTVVEIPAESLLGRHQVLFRDNSRIKDSLADLQSPYPLQPVTETVSLTLSEPTLTENTSDLNRLLLALQKEKGTHGKLSLPVLQELPDLLRENNWQADLTVDMNAGRIIGVAPYGSTRNYGIAIDLGTTTVAVSLLNLNNGQKVTQDGGYNRQAVYGEDVISRVIHATNKANGLDMLRQAALDTINDLIDSILRSTGINRKEIVAASLAGNTIMTHLFLGVTPRHIRQQPYIPAASIWPEITAGETGLAVHPRAPLLVFPSVASYVGGDIVAGTMFTRLNEKESINLFIDIGTNGEMVLGNNDWLIACACSAGPAFEGSGIKFGMRAVEGAVEGIKINPETYDVTLDVIGNTQPTGICGSGLIDCLARLKVAGIIDRTGSFIETDNSIVRQGDEGPEFILSRSGENDIGKDIVITEADIKNLIRSKGAIFAGIQCLLKTVDMELEVIDKIIIAGGFGSYLNIANAVEIGLLPDLPANRYLFAGNTSLKGAELALLSRTAWRQAIDLAHKMTYLELSTGNLFMEEFISALFLPHTRMELFPSILDRPGT